MISQSLSNLKSQFSQKEDVGSYDNIALNQRYCLGGVGGQTGVAEVVASRTNFDFKCQILLSFMKTKPVKFLKL